MARQSEDKRGKGLVRSSGRNSERRFHSTRDMKPLEAVKEEMVEESNLEISSNNNMSVDIDALENLLNNL